MASKLSSAQLVAFALLTFALADPSIKYKLISFLFEDPAGGYLVSAYLKRYAGGELPAEGGEQQAQAGSSAGASSAMAQ